MLAVNPLVELRPTDAGDNVAYQSVQTNAGNIHEVTGLEQIRADYGLTGEGQTVVIIDTGVAYSHLALGGGLGEGYTVVGGFDFTEEWDADPYDDGYAGSHGTHVAGILASTASEAPGIAPGVDIVALRVFNDDGEGSYAWVEQALQWIYDHLDAFENPITTVNLSLGGKLGGSSDDWGRLEDELAALVRENVFIAAAAGNDFEQNGAGLNYPAVSEYVVPVASVDDSGQLSYFSQRDSRVIAAPGRAVLSSVPDYMGDMNGVDDDYARYSGTSMATPYVAGASVLLREAYELAGVTDVSQQQLYDLMANTADTIWDAQTGQYYNRLNLDAAVNAIMPDDDFGSSSATAHELGTIAGDSSFEGTIERLGDQDWFSFTAGATGTATLTINSNARALPQWVSAIDTSQTGTMSLDVVAGQTYVVGLGAADGLARYTFDVSLEGNGDTEPENIDLGTVRQETFEGYALSGEGEWFTVTATMTGTLTVEALFSNADGDVDIELYDADRTLLADSDSASDNERIDVSAKAGETFYLKAFVYGDGTNDDVDLRVTNLVTRLAGTVNVIGTGGDDLFTYSGADGYHDVSINGVDYRFARTSVGRINFDGQGGENHAVLHGTVGDDEVVLRAGSVEMSGSGWQFAASNVTNVTVTGEGGQDRVTFHDSPGRDAFVAEPGSARMYGDGFYNQADGFESIYAYADAGGVDVASLYDSAGDDTMQATSVQAALYGEGFYNHVKYFDAVYAFAENGGRDTALMYDSPGDDTFLATPVQGAMFGQGYYNRAKGFETIHAYGTVGGNDTAKLYDSNGSGTFQGRENQGTVFGEGYYNRAKNFATVYAYAGGRQSVVTATGPASMPESPAEDAEPAVPAKRPEVASTSAEPTPSLSPQAMSVLAGISDWLYDVSNSAQRSLSDADDDEERAAVDAVFESGSTWRHLS